MKQVAKNDWVRIMQIILTPEERLKSLPEKHQKGTFEMLDQWIPNG